MLQLYRHWNQATGVAARGESMLYGTSPRDPATYATVTAMVVLVAILAAYIPGRRAAAAAPAAVLRTE